MTQHVLIVLAVFNPDRAHFREQLASVAWQSHRDFSVLFVAADRTSQPLIEQEAARAGLDHRVVTPPQPLDAVRAFEFGLARALEEAPDTGFFALSDQDDIWHADRLAAGLRALGRSGRDLAHSDARVIDETGRVLHRSLFRMERRRRSPGLRGLFYRNNVTGMTALFTRRLAEAAMPFPPQDGVHFYHDLWLAMVAEVLSGVAFVDRPLVDYRQHGNNAVGAIATRSPFRLAAPRVWLRQQAACYALAMYLARALVLRLGQNRALLPRLDRLKPFLRRLTLGPRFLADAAMLALAGRPGLASRALGFATVAAGRSVWSLRRALGLGLDQALTAFDDRLYALSPGQRPGLPASPGTPARSGAVRWSERALRRTRLASAPAFSAEEPALNILVPTLNPTEIFAGIVTALDIGLGLAARGASVRFIATDLPIASAQATRAFIEQRLPAEAQQGAAAARIALHCGVSDARLPCHPGDRFLATAWWTAHMAQQLVSGGGFENREFLYLIQDFEPNFYPWGAEFAGAAESYGFDFEPIFNTTLLRDYFTANGFAFADDKALCLRPSIDIPTFAGRARPAGGGPRRLALYGRPEVARNMFPLAVGALAAFIEAEGLGPADLSLVSVGLRHEDILFPGDLRMESLGKIPWSDYPDFLSGVDIGLSLMFSPHPSHPPLEMAAAGATVVTNNFGPKDLSALSPAILSSAPTVPALAAGLRRAWHAPPPDERARNIDLSGLGASPDDVVAALAGKISSGPHGLRRAA